MLRLIWTVAQPNMRETLRFYYLVFILFLEYALAEMGRQKNNLLAPVSSYFSFVDQNLHNSPKGKIVTKFLTMIIFYG